MLIAVRSQDIERGDVIVRRTAAPGWPGGLVLDAGWCPTFLSLTLLYFPSCKVITGCAFGADEEFEVERSKRNPVHALAAWFADHPEVR